jgi:outer membrane biosynthesis protein TonB
LIGFLAVAFAQEPDGSVPGDLPEPIADSPDAPTPSPPAPDTSRAVHWSEVQIRTQVNPTFPTAATQLGIREERCILRLHIDTGGYVESVQARSCSTLFLEPAVDAAMQWTFHPFIEAGQAVPVQFDINFRFVGEEQGRSGRR